MLLIQAWILRAARTFRLGISNIGTESSGTGQLYVAYTHPRRSRNLRKGKGSWLTALLAWSATPGILNILGWLAGFYVAYTSFWQRTD